RKEVAEMAKTRMKQLQWDKLSAQHAAETVWSKATVDEQRITEIMKKEGFFEEMEEDFKAKQVARRATAATKKDKIELKTHLSLQTRQGIEMVLLRVKSNLTKAKHATPEEVAHDIVNCNESILDQGFLSELLRHYPESETKGQLGEYRNASNEALRLLHPADRLVVLLMTVPHLKEKVQGLLYLTKYRETYDLIKEGAAKIREGAEAIMKAGNFARLLNIILMMGNFLNSTGVQGGAFGFKISSINKLVDTKASDGTTLLHFVERTVSKCFPEIESFLEELDAPSEACRVQLLDLKRDLAELKSGSFQHKKELDRFLDENEENLNDPYAKLMLPFLREASSELSRLSDQVQYTERIYGDALKYFGEGPDPKRRGFPAPQLMRTEDFFGIFKEFIAAYKKIKMDNVRIGEQRQIEAKRRAAAEEKEKERQEALARKEAGVDDSLVLETLLGNLRQSGGTPKNKRKARERRSAAKENVNASPTPMDGNPSDLAAAMLAKLQGGQ
ncbi:actin-binding FH2, partial [Tilletiaria anomala UBC 951]